MSLLNLNSYHSYLILIILQTNNKRNFKKKPMKSKPKYNILKYKPKFKLKIIITKL